MNALTVQPIYNPKLPAFLRTAALFDPGLTGGISGGQPPTISIKGSKWALLDANGETLHVQQMHLDVIVVGFNPSVSKTYFEGRYDPNNSGPPVCWSDNGVGPSSQAEAPQAPGCGNCPKNAVGSKISETGSSTKACQDSKKLAVVLAAPTQCVINGAAQVVQPYRDVYLLKLPYMSTRPWREYAEGVKKHNWPVVAGVVIRLSFDPEVSYPKVAFNSVSLIGENEEAVYNAIAKHLDSDATREAVGANDLPLSGGAATYEATRVAVLNPGSAGQQPAPAFTPTPTAPVAAAPASTTFPQATPAAPTQEAPAATARRRRTAAPASVQPASAPAQAFAPAPQAGPFSQPTIQTFPSTNGAGNGVIQTPQASDAQLDAQLDALFA